MKGKGEGAKNKKKSLASSDKGAGDPANQPPQPHKGRDFPFIILFATSICAVTGFGIILSSAVIIALFLGGALHSVPFLNLIIEGFAGRATLFGIFFLAMGLLSLASAYLLRRLSKVGGFLALLMSVIFLFSPAATFFLPVAIEPFAIGVVIGGVLLPLIAYGWSEFE